MEFDKSRPDYDPDLDFDDQEPRRVYHAGLRNCDIRPEPPTRGNSLKAQLDEIWNRPGICAISHVCRWHFEDGGRIVGYSFGRLLVPKHTKFRRRNKRKGTLL